MSNLEGYMEKNFNDFRFSGLNYRECSNKYYTMNRINNDETKIVVKVESDHLLKTKFGWALVLNKCNVVFLKEWQVNCNWYGNYVLLEKSYFQIKTWGTFEMFDDSTDLLSWEAWLNVAKEQRDYVDEDGDKKIVRWEK
jgi:hypothetical protein